MVGVRVSGLASGMDIDSIVKDLMRAERMPLDKIEKEKTTLEWKRDAYREINTAIYSFYNDLLDFTLERNYQTRSISSTNEDFITATAASGAGTGTYTISEVTHLATAANMINAGAISADKNNKVDFTKGLYSIKDSFAAKPVENEGIVNDPFKWQIGSIINEVTKIENETNTVELKSIPTSEETISVRINGKGVKVSFTKPENFEDTNETLVWFNTEKGTLNFNKTLAKNDVVEVDYAIDQKEETRTISRENKKIHLDGALVEESLEISFDKSDGTTVNLQFSPVNGEGSEQRIGRFVKDEGTDNEVILAEINYDTGEITFKDEFFDEYSIEDSEELELSIKSQQYYFTFDVATHTSEGKMYENFIVKGTETLNKVFEKVNNSSLGLMMFYDSHTDKVTLTRTETGNFSDEDDIQIGEGFLRDVLKFNGDKQFTEGINAKFTINGLDTERTSNTFTINGVSITLKNTFNETEGIQPVTLSVNNDSEKLFESIKGFVDKYNEIVEKIEEKLNEPYYKGYAPLSDLEREELTDKQQEKWEEMARSGLLRRDPILSSMITQMRSALSAVVNNNEINPQMTTLSSIGINTTADFRSAKLQLDETKLREAIENDPESVELLFRSGDSNSTFGEKGVVRRLRDILQGTRDRIQARAGNANMTEHQYTIGRQIANFEDRIERFEQRLQRLEDRYYRQFTLMEKAIMQSNNQMMQLSQFFM